MLIVAVDPGRVTGLAICAIGTNGDFTFLADEMPSMPACSKIHDWLTALAPGEEKHVVCERFSISQFTAKHTRQNDALEVIGVCKYLVTLHTNRTYYEQNPAQRTIVTNAMLKTLGWYRSSPDKHMVDAAKHLVVHMAHQGLIDLGSLMEDADEA